MHTVTYKPSPDGAFLLSQRKRGLGESGLVELLPMALFRDDDDLVSFDEYLLLPCNYGWDCWNPQGTRCFFLAMRYPKGTFPALEMDLPEDKAVMVLSVLDVTELKVIHETVLGMEPLSVSWNPTGEWAVIMRDEQKEREHLRSRARSEYDQAVSYMRSTGAVQQNDPANDPARLEHYLMNYDERYCGPDPFAYAVRQRNLYLKAQEMAIPYDEHILEKTEPEKVTPPPEQEPSAEPEEAAEPALPETEEASPATPDPDAFHAPTKEERAHNRGILFGVAVFIVVILLVFAIFMVQTTGSASLLAAAVGTIGATIVRITAGWKRVFPRKYNIARIWVFLGLTISTLPYQAARGVNYLVTRAVGEPHHGWVFVISSICLLWIWAFCVLRRNACSSLSEAKRWGWTTPVLAALIVGFFIFTTSTFQ